MFLLFICFSCDGGVGSSFPVVSLVVTVSLANPSGFIFHGPWCISTAVVKSTVWYTFLALHIQFFPSAVVNSTTGLILDSWVPAPRISRVSTAAVHSATGYNFVVLLYCGFCRWLGFTPPGTACLFTLMRLLLLLWLICQYFTCGEKTVEATAFRSEVSFVVAPTRTPTTYIHTAFDVSTSSCTAPFKRSCSPVLGETDHWQAVRRNGRFFKRPMALWAMPQADQSDHPILSPMWGSLDRGCGRIVQTWTDEEGFRQQLGMGPMDRLECGKWKQEPYILSTGSKSISQSSQRKEGQEQRKVQRTRCTRKWRTFLSIIATVPIYSGGSIYHRYNGSALVCGEVCRTTFGQSGVDPGSAESLSRPNWIAPGAQGHPGQDGEFRDEEDHVGSPQVNSGPWKSSQATFGVAGSQVAAQGEVGAALECLAGRLAKADRKFRQATSAVQYVDPTSDHRTALSSELDTATQCQSRSRSKYGVPPGRNPCRKSRRCNGGRGGEEAQGKDARDHRKGSQGCRDACHRDCGGGGFSGVKASKIERAISERRDWWKCTCADRFHLKNGSIVSCLRKVQCGPLPNHKAVVFSDVEAYGNDCCAASMPDPAVLALSPAVHSVVFEDDCIFDFEATGRAQLLHGEVINDETDVFLLSEAEKLNFQSDPTMSGRCPLVSDPTIPCHPHVFDRWCDGLEGRGLNAPSEHSSFTVKILDYFSTTPLRCRLLDERNSASTSVGLAESPHIEGLERIGDLEDEQLVIIDEWQNLLEILHQNAPSPDSLIHLEMYGLHITHHSIRITDCEATIAAVREAVQESWRDAMPPRSVAYIHLVRPQEQRHARAVVLQVIVEIVPFGVDIPPNDVPILRRIRWHRDHSMTLETAYMRDHQTGFELLLDAHLDEWCHPGHGVQCNLHIESRIALMAHRHHLLPGSLLEVFIHDDDRPEPSASSQQADLQTGQQQPATDNPGPLQDRLADWPGPQVSLVMYGLCGSSLGTRYSTSQADYQQVRATVHHTWQDYVYPDTSVTMHMVRPQDDRQPDHLHLIVELTSLSQARPAGYLPILQRISWHNIWHGDTSVAAYRVPGQTMREVIAACSLTEWCGPYTRAICRMQVERWPIPTNGLIEFQAGSLLEVFVTLQQVEEDGASLLQSGAPVSDIYLAATEHAKPSNVPLDSLSTHVNDRWCDSLSSGGVQKVASETRPIQARPNNDIVPDQDSQVPYQYRLHNGARIPGTIIPPPNWNRLPGLRYASDRGAVVRDANHQLRVRIRSWLVPHDRFGPMYWKDCTVPAQLFLRLLDRLKSVWRPELFEGDRLHMRIVQPTPAPPVGDQVRLYILLECNRPHVSTRKAILLSFQELNPDGPSPDLIWIPYLAPEVITPQIIAGVLPMHCDPRHLIVAGGTPDRRWLAEHEERAVGDGLYLPTLRDTRRVVPTQRIEIDEATLIQMGLRENEGEDQTLMQWGEDGSGDAVQLMQRSSTRSPRRGLQGLPPSTSTDGSGPDLLLVHTYHMSASHKLVHLDKSRPLSYSAQLEEMWRFPPHTSILGLHEVRHPPQDLESTSQATLLVERTVDLHRQAIADDQLVLSDVVLSGAGTVDPIRIRRVVWTRRFMTRPAVLHLFATQEFCNSPEVTCHLSVNRVVWSQHDTASRELRHGDFFCLRIAGPLTMTNEEVRAVLTDQEQADSSRYLYCSSPARSSPPPTTPDEGGESEPEILQDPPVDAIDAVDPQFAAQAESRTSTYILRKATQRRSPLVDVTNLNRFDAYLDADAATLASLPSSSPQLWDSHYEPCHPHVTDRWCDDGVHVADSLDEKGNAAQALHLQANNPQHTGRGWSRSKSRQQAEAERPSSVVEDEQGDPIKVDLDRTIDASARYAHFSSADMCKAHRCLSMLKLPPFLFWNDISDWHPATVTAFDELSPLPWERFTPVKFAFYTDGGSKSGEDHSRQGAAAVVLIVTTNVGHHFGGIQARSVSHPATAPLTEAWALLQATLWATSILNAFPHADVASFAFYGDAIGPGAFATGRWFPNVHTHVHNMCRNIIFWVEERIGLPCEWNHIKAHSGHPWNEAADTVATCVIEGALPTPDCDSLWKEITGFTASIEAFGWLWYIERQLRSPNPSVMLTDTDVIIKMPPQQSGSTFDDLHVLQHWQPEHEWTGDAYSQQVRIASINVTSLFSGKQQQTGQGGFVSARMEEISQQCASQHINIVGIQETRQKRDTYIDLGPYHVVSGSATAGGHGGVQAWIAKDWGADIRIRSDHIRVLHSTSRMILVAIRAPFVHIGV